MLLSVMVMGTGAASFTDQDEFSDNYAEAAEVLTGMGIDVYKRQPLVPISR